MRKKRESKYPELNSKEWVYESYTIKELSLQKTADIVGHGCTSGAVNAALIRFGIPLRTQSEAEAGEKNPFYGKCHSEETKNKIRKAKKGTPNVMKGKHHTEISREHMREAHKEKSVEHLENYQFKKGIEPWNKGKQGVYSEDTLKRISESLQGRFSGEKHPFYGRHHTEEAKTKNREKHLGNHHSEATRAIIAETSKQHWQDLEFVKKVMAGAQVKPNKLEQKVDIILQKYFPNTWKYNGDFSCGITIGGMIPDFVNINGGKVVIEVFGEPWHDSSNTFLESIPWGKTEFGRKTIYSQYGYGCIVLWGNDLKKNAETFIISTLREYNFFG